MPFSSWSATAGLNVLSSGVSGSGGVNIDEGMAPSGVNNAMRDIMAQLVTLFTDANFSLTSTDAGATANPTLTLYRNSASPAASDLIGTIVFNGEDSAGNTETYADILASISDPTSTSEDGALAFRTKVAGTLRATLALGAGTATLTDFDAGATVGPTLSLYRASASPAAADIISSVSFVGKDSAANDTTYADMYATISDPVDGSEDGTMTLRTMVAGTLRATLEVGAGMATLTDFDAGATANPTLTLYRNSASPAASDVIGKVLFQGEDSAGNTEDYADISAVIVDPTSTSEDATLLFRNKVGGTMRDSWQIAAGTASLTHFDDGAGAGPIMQLTRSSASAAASDVLGVLQFIGNDAGGNSTIYADQFVTIDDTTDGSEDGTLTMRAMVAGTLTNRIVANAAGVTVSGAFEAGSTGYFTGTVRVGQNTTNSPGSINNTAGISIASTGNAYFSSPSQTLSVNVTTDGQLVLFNSGGTNQGIISVSGATVSYASFFGSHWSQLADGSRPDIPRGTVVESIDQMCKWSEEVNDHLPCFKISDTAGSRRVYGVFAWWDEGETNDAFVGSLGAYMIRMEKGAAVEIGDLIESAGNGCGRVQADDIMRSRTVAKVTSSEIIETYPDGSFTVPCTLHCG